MQLGEEVYLPGDQKLEPCFDFEVEQIDDKTFFHTLNYSGRPLSSSHLNIIFYYLRKKAKYGINMPIKVTTTDTLFNNIIQRVFTEFVKGGKQDHLIDRSDDIMEYMKGFRMHCNTPWHQVDHVLFPINLAEIWHWILGCVSFHKRCFYVYDSLRSRKHKKAIQKVAEAYAVLIPLFLVSIEFYNQRSDIVVENGLHMGKKLTDPFDIELITNLPTQQNSDCGVYVACFAEYIIEDLPIPVANFDVDGLRARFGILLWHYGRNKKLHANQVNLRLQLFLGFFHKVVGLLGCRGPFLCQR
uniref:Ubiquitin-like protease family profile domain-containing protein n=1 Tax=Nicotiana tabacum TaxID=4097 RepID=A0A1S4DGG4_TOBAC